MLQLLPAMNPTCTAAILPGTLPQSSWILHPPTRPGLCHPCAFDWGQSKSGRGKMTSMDPPQLGTSISFALLNTNCQRIDQLQGCLRLPIIKGHGIICHHITNQIHSTTCILATISMLLCTLLIADYPLTLQYGML